MRTVGVVCHPDVMLERLLYTTQGLVAIVIGFIVGLGVAVGLIAFLALYVCDPQFGSC